jgi:sensor histidine kinase YesM
LFWLIVAVLWFYLRYQDYETLQQAGVVTVIKVADLALIIYFANLVLVPKFLYRKKYFLFALFFVVAVAVSSFLKFAQLSWVLGDGYLPEGSGIKEKVYNNFVTQFFLVLASIGLKSVVDYLQLQKKLAEVAKQKLEAELNFLKSQVNPHFLFNSLNAVYFLIDKNNQQARSALHKFSEMLRYQLYECNDSKIPIEKEIAYLKDYVALQQLRVTNTEIKFDCTPDVVNFSIEPLLLIPFVENSFKHLSHFDKEQQNKVKIAISRTNGSMHFSVYNTTENNSVNGEGRGIGLINVKKRLELLYPGKHQFSYSEKQNWFGIVCSCKFDF